MQTRIIVADFAGANNTEYYRSLEQKCADLDIAIVVANAGVMTVGEFDKIPARVSQEMIDVNSYHYAMMQRIFLERLLERADKGKRCALIGVSSCSWLRYFPRFAVYAATKAFASYLSMAM